MIPEVRACSTLSALPHHWIYRENAGALDRTRAAVGTWLHARPRDWLGQVAAVALDPWRGNASALVAPLGHATVVVDHFPRLQQATLGIGAVSVIRCTASASCC